MQSWLPVSAQALAATAVGTPAEVLLVEEGTAHAMYRAHWVGLLGSAVAARLLQHGFEVIGYDTRVTQLEALRPRVACRRQCS